MRKMTVGMALLVLLVPGFLMSCGSDDPVVLDFSDIEYYTDTYDTCRGQFRYIAAELQRKYSDLEIGSLPVPSSLDGDLTINYCYKPAEDHRERLFIFTSGVHGVEGYTGSAVQDMFLSEMFELIDFDTTGVLVIHGINPYGFKYLRRVSENNVDLNRNFSVSPDLFQTENEGYAKLNGFLNPTTPVALNLFTDGVFYVTAVVDILRYGMDTLRQAILQGQYDYPDGIYFGGFDFEVQKTLLQPLLLEKMTGYPLIMAVDLHTGYGARGGPAPVPHAHGRPCRAETDERPLCRLQTRLG